MSTNAGIEDRLIAFGDGLPRIPERLLLAHARGEVLFICGAGISIPAGLPSFRKLVKKVYKELDGSVFDVIKEIPGNASNQWVPEWSGLNPQQKAEVKRYIAGDYDVVLGMLERRLDNQTLQDSEVRKAVEGVLRTNGSKPEAIHRALIRLADRGPARTIVTTNFDRLLEAAARNIGRRIGTYSLGSIPRPSWRPQFEGVLHIHGALDASKNRVSELVLSDEDFGEFYLRRRVVPDFIYDAARLFHLVLIGYSANDPPMRYLLNAVAADGSRFLDIKERFTFFGCNPLDVVAVEDWKARGITPIPYDSGDDHGTLLQTLEKWAKLAPNAGTSRGVDAQVRRIVKKPRAEAREEEKDLFAHFIRRSDEKERIRLSKLVSKASADFGWLDTIMEISKSKEQDQKT